MNGPESSSTVKATRASEKNGASFTGVTVMVKVFVAWSTPPSPVPPLSCVITVTVAVPFLSAAGRKVSTPLLLMAGWVLKSAVLLLDNV